MDLVDPSMTDPTTRLIGGRPARTTERLLASGATRRTLPSPTGIARRRILLRLTKLILPVFALLLLATIAMWPEIARLTNAGRIAFKSIHVTVDGAELTDPRYHGVDERGRPYTLSASTARQIGPERVNLVDPKGDITQENGSWFMAQSRRGVLMQKANQLDLSEDVVLYRDDGTTMRTNSASVDFKQSAAAGSEHVSAEGPFGTLEATGFTLTDRGGIVQFAGPIHLVLNGQNP